MLHCEQAGARIWKSLQAYALEFSQFYPVQRGFPAWAWTNDLVRAYAPEFSPFGQGQNLPRTLDGEPRDVQKALALP
jgi:hypothetical protein